MKTKTIKYSLILCLFALLSTIGGCGCDKANENDIYTFGWGTTIGDLTEMRKILPFFADPSFELVLNEVGEYEVDLDFDEIKERLTVDDESNLKVYKKDSITGKEKDVSLEFPYCIYKIHPCCPPHNAYTVINYLSKTIYVETHYGATLEEVGQWKKVGDKWVEIEPILPTTIRSLYLLVPLRKVFGGKEYKFRPNWQTFLFY